jgi:hypothetical protein
MPYIAEAHSESDHEVAIPETALKMNSCMMYLIDCKNPCKCHKVSPPIPTVKEKRRSPAASLEKENRILIISQ